MKFEINDKVIYTGSINALRNWFNEKNSLRVIGIIKDGEKIDKYERNISGQTIYRVTNEHTSYIFLENELTKIS